MVKIENLSKSFNRLGVLKNINLEIKGGKITAIVGPNGSGKTTLLKCLLGMVKPDCGEIFINGNKISDNWRYRNVLGYMPQSARFPDNLTVRQVLDMICDLRGNPGDVDDELIVDFSLEREMEKRIRMLSGGTKQKLSAVIAFLFKPEMLILDEPTAGLDPRASSRLKDKILLEKSNGKTIILTSHIMSELEELSDNVVFLLNGRINFLGSIDSIMFQTRQTKLERAIANMMEKGQE